MEQKYAISKNTSSHAFEGKYREYYIASCVFTSKYPQLSQGIQNYVTEHFGIPIVRCCVPNYKYEVFNGRMPENYRPKWSNLPDCGDYAPGDTVYSLCHNCSAIIEEYKNSVKTKSLWELILSDKDFCYPDYTFHIASLLFEPEECRHKLKY